MKPHKQGPGPLITGPIKSKPQTFQPIAPSPWGKKSTPVVSHPLRHGETPRSGFGVIGTRAASLGYGNYVHRKNFVTTELLNYITQASGTGCRVVDLGCGDAYWSMQAIRLGAAHVDAVDIHLQLQSPTLPTEYRGKINLITSPAIAYLEHLGRLSPSSADVIIMFNLLHYLSPDEEDHIFRLCHNVLRPGGCLFITALTTFASPYDEQFFVADVKDSPLNSYIEENIRRGVRYPSFLDPTKIAQHHWRYTEERKMFHPQDLRVLGRILPEFGFGFMIPPQNFSISPDSGGVLDGVGVVCTKLQ